MQKDEARRFDQLGFGPPGSGLGTGPILCQYSTGGTLLQVDTTARYYSGLAVQSAASGGY